jgi:hypothetical protein
MKLALFFVVGLLAGLCCLGQEVVVDVRHALVVQENQAVRMAAEGTHQQYLDKIGEDIRTVNTNAGSVVLAQTLVYNALANVNSVFRDGLMMKTIALTVADIKRYLAASLTLTRDDPFLLLVASQVQSEFAAKAGLMVSDISGFILKEGGNVLADYNGRDELLRHVLGQLQILDGMAYGAWKSMYWAKERGVLKTLNPFAGYINTDRQMVYRIIQSAKFLKPE